MSKFTKSIKKITKKKQDEPQIHKHNLVMNTLEYQLPKKDFQKGHTKNIQKLIQKYEDKELQTNNNISTISIQN